MAIKAAEQIEPRMLDRDPARAGVFGNLIFNAASAALRSGNSRRADDLLAGALRLTPAELTRLDALHLDKS